ncbi:hypothetical protein DH2020_027333 [Rehmannia glutinosa]|uniref:PPM-type phosphatase domain-containing protein n=1 Tax=Rehmannia glutinosa TaxID=99300 RepID=A0ABR0VWA7_REHGL
MGPGFSVSKRKILSMTMMMHEETINNSGGEIKVSFAINATARMMILATDQIILIFHLLVNSEEPAAPSLASQYKLPVGPLVKIEFKPSVRKKTVGFFVLSMMALTVEMQLIFWRTLYETVAFHLNLLDWNHESEYSSLENVKIVNFFDTTLENRNVDRSFKQSVLNSLQHAINQAEAEFLHMVEQEMDDRPDLVSIGSCVLLVLLHGKNLYVLNLGDSRAVLATYDRGIDMNDSEGLKAVQLTDSHTVDNEVERIQLVNDHPDDPSTVVAGKVKGKLKKCMNDALMGILRVRNLISPPYVSLLPSLSSHEVSNSDHFVVLGSDGLFDFFSNDEVVKLVNSYILRNPSGDPAKFLVEQLAARAADSAGFSMEELMSIPAGRRRKYHDDVTVIVIVLGTNKRTSKASTCL